MCLVLCHLRRLTCKRFNARALKQSGRAVVIVELFVRQFEAGVDAAVLLSDFSIVKVCGGGHSCHREERDQTPHGATRRQDSGMPEMDDLKGERDGEGV